MLQQFPGIILSVNTNEEQWVIHAPIEYILTEHQVYARNIPEIFKWLLKISNQMWRLFLFIFYENICQAVPQLSPWCQTLQFFPICHWCPPICYSSARAQREWGWVSPCAGLLRGSLWNSSSFFHRLKPHWGLQSNHLPEIMGVYLLGTGTLSWGWGRDPSLQLSLLNCYPPHTAVGPACSTSLHLIPVWMDMI